MSEINVARTIRTGAVLFAFGCGAIALIFFYGTVRSEILISDRMSEFVDTVDHHQAKNEHKLIALDLDDTVFMSSQLVGTPTWFYNMVNLMRQSGAAKYEALGVASTIDKFVQEKIQVVAVEQATLSAIRTWQKIGIIVVGLTSRPKDMATITKGQLKEIDLDFHSPYFPCVEASWTHEGGGFINGVVYVEEYVQKNEMFAQFYDLLKSCGATINLIAQADDQQRYVTNLAKIAKKERTDFIGIIYGGALASREFDFKKATKQLFDLESLYQTSIIPEEYRSVFLSYR